MSSRAPISDINARILLAETGLCNKPSNHRAKPVLVDGKLYGSVRSAAAEIECSPISVLTAIRENRTCKGRTVAYAD